MADSTLFNRTVAHNDAFRETLLEFADTRSIPGPEEPSPAWRAWEAARSEAFLAVIASVDHYCAGRVLEVLTAVTQEIEQGRGMAGYGAQYHSNKGYDVLVLSVW